MLNAHADIVVDEATLASDVTFTWSAVDYGYPAQVAYNLYAVYGEAENLPVTEQTPRLPATSPYGTPKTMCEDILRDSVAAYGSLKGIALRYFNPIGAHPSALIGELPRGVPQNLVPYITQTAAGLRECLSVFGNDERIVLVSRFDNLGKGASGAAIQNLNLV